MKEGTLYISADTMMIADNKIHHKPQTLEEAKITLTSYIGLPVAELSYRLFGNKSFE